jgi:hypothetical protein
MAKQSGKKGKTSVKRMVLTFTDSPLDQELYAALQQTAEADDTTLRPYLIKFYLRNVCGMQEPDYCMLKRMGLPDDLASLYSKPKDSPFRKALEGRLRLKNMLKGLDELGLLEAQVMARVKAIVAKEQAA